MKIIIDISEEEYKCVQLTGHIGNATAVSNAIYEGTPLPKGHGRLIDADELKKYYPHDTDWEYPVNTNEYVNETIDNAPTIIEADKE